VDWPCCAGCIYNDKSFAKMACVLLSCVCGVLIAGAVISNNAVKRGNARA
jgi:hypothetical protein